MIMMMISTNSAFSPSFFFQRFFDNNNNKNNSNNNYNENANINDNATDQDQDMSEVNREDFLLAMEVADKIYY